VSVGDNVVDRSAEYGTAFPGGGAVNVAVFASRCQGDAAYVGVLGSDEDGELVVQALKAEQVDTQAIRWTDEPTAVAEIAIDEHGDRQFTSWTPIAEQITIEDVANCNADGTEWFYTGYV